MQRQRQGGEWIGVEVGAGGIAGVFAGLKKTSRDREQGQEMEMVSAGWREAEGRTLQGQCRGRRGE